MNKNFDFYKSLIKNEEFEGVHYENNLWDLVVITAISERQKSCYEKQIQTKLEKNLLPRCFKYIVFNDPDEAKIGSGGSTLNVLKKLNEQFGQGKLSKMKILLIHAGGYSQVKLLLILNKICLKLSKFVA